MSTSVVPALRAALREGGSVDLRSACLLALAKVGDDPPEEDLFDVLSEHLDDPVQELSESAALALGLCGRERALFLLADLIDDREPARARLGGAAVPVRTRAFAAYALGLGAGRSAREDVRRFAVSRLAASFARERFAARDVPIAIVQALGLVRLQAIGDAGEQGSASSSRAGQVRHLLGILADAKVDDLTRAHVPGSLGALLEDVELEEGGAELKQTAAAALIELLDPHADTTAELRQGAVVALQLLGDADADPIDRRIANALRRTAREFEPLTRGLALIALGDSAARAGTGAPAADDQREVRAFLLARLGQGTTLTRPWAAFGLALSERRRQRAGWDALPEAAGALRGALEQARSPEERTALSLALGLIADPAARAPVLRLFEGPGSDDVRGTFAVALGLLRAVEASEPLAETVRNSRFRPGLLRDAAVGLALIGDKAAVPLLASELAEAGSLSSQAALCAALGTVGDARSVESLVAFLRDEKFTA
ncbi:MAG TPA: HEAT repeat domain-containing protein, partial [Planctomycetota bacterium]|nr:HEAT repeat domain-containing protein [Planctomycetota bacterium]